MFIGFLKDPSCGNVLKVLELLNRTSFSSVPKVPRQVVEQCFFKLWIPRKVLVCLKFPGGENVPVFNGSLKSLQNF